MCERGMGGREREKKKHVTKGGRVARPKKQTTTKESTFLFFLPREIHLNTQLSVFHNNTSSAPPFQLLRRFATVEVEGTGF